jgi:hypothetical protein
MRDSGASDCGLLRIERDSLVSSAPRLREEDSDEQAQAVHGAKVCLAHLVDRLRRSQEEPEPGAQ